MVPSIAHAIRDHVLNARMDTFHRKTRKTNRSSRTGIFGAKWEGMNSATGAIGNVNVFRDSDEEVEFEPMLRILDPEDVERLNRERGREARRQRRSQRITQTRPSVAEQKQQQQQEMDQDLLYPQIHEALLSNHHLYPHDNQHEIHQFYHQDHQHNFLGEVDGDVEYEVDVEYDLPDAIVDEFTPLWVGPE